MTFLEAKHYSSITPTDCVTYLLGQNAASAINVAREWNNRIVNWVTRSVLEPDRINDRAAELKFFIKTAKVCN